MRSEEDKTVSYLGPKGTYSHQAALQAFDNNQNTLVPEPSILNCFLQLKNEKADFAVIPFENSTNGSVNMTLDILRDFYHKHGSTAPEMSIVGEEYVAINHCLITEAKDLTQIKRVYSHPQVWGQVDNWYHQHLNGIQQIDASSTSKAVKIIKGDPSSAAIAGSTASEALEVPILEANISNSKTNQTRFLIFSRLPKEKLYHGDEYNTLISFTVEHHSPGALVNALGVFAKQNINMTSIASRPRPVGESDPWTYVYFIEIRGHESDPALQTAFEEMQQYCIQLKILGSFKRNRR